MGCSGSQNADAKNATISSQNSNNGGEFNKIKEGNIQGKSGAHIEQKVISGNRNFCSATMGGTCHYEANNICKQCGEPKKEGNEDNGSQPYEGTGEVVDQKMISGPSKYCPRTMGGQCHYDENGICKLCKGERESEVIEQRMLNGPTKSCSASMGGQCYYNNEGICDNCREPRQNDEVIMQEADGGYNKDWCSATMGGTCDLDNNGVCRRCNEKRF